MTKVLQFGSGKQKAKAEGLRVAERAAANSHTTAFYRRYGQNIPTSANNSATKPLPRSLRLESKRKVISHSALEKVETRLLTAEEAAVYLRISFSTLAQWRRKNIGPRVTRIGRSVRYRMTDLDAFEENPAAFLEGSGRCVSS